MRRPFAILALILLAGCQYNPYAHLFTTTQPKLEDVVGSYLLAQQRITAPGLAVLQGRQCQLDLHQDGTFNITNYPTWTEAFSPANGQFVALISATGRWSCETTGSVSDGRTSKDHWGVVFSDADQKLHALDLTGQTPPYGLIMTYGDGDAGTVMIFEKKK